MKKLAIISLVLSAAVTCRAISFTQPDLVLYANGPLASPVILDWWFHIANHTTYNLTELVPDIQGITNDPAGNVSWNFDYANPEGGGLRLYWIWASDYPGVFDEVRIYRVSYPFGIIGSGNVGPAQQIQLWGTFPYHTPETGSTFLLFFLGLGVLFGVIEPLTHYKEYSELERRLISLALTCLKQRESGEQLNMSFHRAALALGADEETAVKCRKRAYDRWKVIRRLGSPCIFAEAERIAQLGA